MKKSTLVIVIVLVLIVLMGGCKYNSLVKQDEAVKTKWGTVESQYQRRADLIPNLVSTVKGAANFEKETLTQVMEARAKATQITVNADDLSPEKLQQFQQAQGQLSSALGRLLAVSESYPDLKANQNFRDLQAQLEGTENRIAVARTDFNETVTGYNSAVRTFPGNIVSGIFGFKQRPYYKADEGAQNAPKVNF